MLEQSGIRKSFYTNWIDSGLAARARVEVEDNTTGTPVAVTTLSVVEWKPGIYLASFLPSPGIPYLYTARVYTDGTFTALDTNYAADAGDFSCFTPGGSSSTGASAEEDVLFEDESDDDVLLDDDSSDSDILTDEEDCS